MSAERLETNPQRSSAPLGDYGDYFFHYTTRDAAFEDILPERRLRLSPYSKMRDPMEYIPWVLGGAFFAESFQAEEEDPEHPMEVLAKANEGLNAIKNQTKLLALTLDAEEYRDRGERAQHFGRGWARARMWEHYAENHEGVCLLFRKDELDRRIDEDLQARELDIGPTRYKGEVTYTDTGLVGEPDARNLMLDQFEKGASARMAAEHLEKYHRELFFLKTRDWETEYEYRYAVFTPGEEYEFIDFGDALAAVIVGWRFPAWEAAGALEVCDDVGADAFRLSWLPEGPFPTPLDRFSEMEPENRTAVRMRRQRS